MVTEEQVYEALHEVYDPELGLIYGVAVEGNAVDVTITMTTPGCPMHDAIAEGTKTTVAPMPGVQVVRVHVVWCPRWDPSMMSEAARHALWG